MSSTGPSTPEVRRARRLLDIEAERERLAVAEFRSSVFTELELEPVMRRTDPVPGLAARMAAKQAVCDVLRLTDVDLRLVGIHVGSDGRPGVDLDHVLRPADADVRVSMSHDGGLAVGFAVSWGPGSVPE